MADLYPWLGFLALLLAGLTREYLDDLERGRCTAQRALERTITYYTALAVRTGRCPHLPTTIDGRRTCIVCGEIGEL